MHLTFPLWLRSPGVALLYVLLRLQSFLPRPLRRLGKKSGRRRYSVVTAVYNAERWLPAYFASIVCQTLDVENCLEVLCVDDGSTDASAAVVRRWQRRYPGMIRLLCKRNGGPASARNAGIESAEGEWITFVDADDFIDPGYLAAVDDFLAAPAQRPVGMLVCRYLTFKQANGVYKDSHPLRRRFHNGPCRIPADATGTFVQVVCNSAFFLRRVFHETGIRQKEDVRPTFEDGEMVMRYVAAVASYGMDIGVAPEARYYHRRTAEVASLSQRAYRDPAHFDAPLALGCLRLLRELAAQQGAVPRFAQMTVLYCLSRYMRRILEDSTFFSLEERHRRRFFALFRDIVELVDISAIRDARYFDAPPFFAPLLACAYKNRELTPQRVFVEAVGAGSNELRVVYYSRSPRTGLRFFLDGIPLEPLRSETVRLPEWDGHVLHEHRRSFAAGAQGACFHSDPGSAEFFDADGKTSLGQACWLSAVKSPD